MAQTNELVLAEQVTALKVFSTEGGLDPIVQEAKDFVSEFEHDLSTGAGRKRTASLAAKVAKLKVRLDEMGKDLVSDWKSKSNKVDISRKAMRDELDQLKVEARKPLTDWEDQQKRIKEEEAARLEAERVAAEIESAHEIALLMNEKFDRDAAEARAEDERMRQAEADRLAKEQTEREERLKQEAAESARIEAERAAKAERDRIEQERIDALLREQRAKDQAAEAERQRIAAEERAKVQEQERIRAATQAKEEARLEAERAEVRRKESEERARQQEIQRQKDEEARIQREQEQREANNRHVGAVRKAAKESLMELGLDEMTAKRVVATRLRLRCRRGGEVMRPKTDQIVQLKIHLQAARRKIWEQETELDALRLTLQKVKKEVQGTPSRGHVRMAKLKEVLGL